MTTPHILIIDQDLLLAARLQAALEDVGYQVRVATSLIHGLTLARRSFPTLVVVALALPDGSGRDVVTRLRTSSAAVPIIVLADPETVEDQRSLLHSGATECVSKPVLVRALVARIQGHLRRPEEDDSLSYGGLRVVPDQLLVMFEGNVLNLTDTECRILALLLRERGRIVVRAELAHALWVDHAGSERSNVMDVHVAHLRAKLSAVRLYGMIRTVRGVGYTIRLEPQAAK